LPRHTDARHCPECGRRKLPFRAALALGEYRGALRDAVLRTKRAAFESLTLQMGEVLADRLEQLGWRQQCDVVVPLPSHWWRRWTRGTSGPELLAERIANRLALPCRTRWLVCQRRTRKQGMLLPNERAENVRGAFAVRLPEAVRGQRILLIDDVMTTGATLKEAATALLRARAASVSVAVLARGTGD
jgi:ComF family protein